MADLHISTLPEFKHEKFNQSKNSNAKVQIWIQKLLRTRKIHSESTFLCYFSIPSLFVSQNHQQAISKESQYHYYYSFKL